ARRMISNSFISVARPRVARRVRFSSSSTGTVSGAALRAAKALGPRRLVEHRVHEPIALGGPVTLGELDGLVDHDLRRDVGPITKLRERHEQNRTPDRVELLERARGELRDRAVEICGLADGLVEQIAKIALVDLRELGELRELPLELGEI